MENQSEFCLESGSDIPPPSPPPSPPPRAPAGRQDDDGGLWKELPSPQPLPPIFSIQKNLQMLGVSFGQSARDDKRMRDLYGER